MELIYQETIPEPETYFELRKSVGWNVLGPEQSEKGKEEFYVKQGFKILPNEWCGPALRRVIHK